MKRVRVWDPAAHLVLACRPGLGEFFLQQGLVDEVVEVDKKDPQRRKQAFQKLRAQTWEVIIVPHQSPRTAFWMWRLKAKVTKVSFAKWWNRFIYPTRVVRPVALPDALRQLSLMAPIDSHLAELFATEEVQELANSESQIPINLSPIQIPKWASMQVLQHRPERRVVYLAPGSVWATKRWTKSGFVEVASSLLAKGFEVELVGSAQERALCDEVQTLVPGIKNSAGQTSFAELVTRLSKGLALVSNDSGAMHAAAAAGLPTVSIFGPTTLELGFRPWNQNSVVVQKPLLCRPCGKHGAQVCPIGTHACMKSVRSSEVMEALAQFGI